MWPDRPGTGYLQYSRENVGPGEICTFVCAKKKFLWVFVSQDPLKEQELIFFFVLCRGSSQRLHTREVSTEKRRDKKIQGRGEMERDDY